MKIFHIEAVGDFGETAIRDIQATDRNQAIDAFYNSVQYPDDWTIWTCKEQ